MNDIEILTKLAENDMVTLGARYHSLCLLTFVNKARPRKEITKEEEDRAKLHSQAFADLISYMEDCCDGDAPVFKLADLKKKYNNRLDELGVTDKTYVHSSRLCARILRALPDFTATNHGHHVLLTNKDTVGSALIQACHCDSLDDDALLLMHAAKVLRKDTIDHQYSFEGSFNDDSQKNSAPASLLSTVNMILNGTDNADTQVVSPAVSSISDLIVFNCVKRSRDATEKKNIRHVKETPLPIYLALKIHGTVRNKGKFTIPGK